MPSAWSGAYKPAIIEHVFEMRSASTDLVGSARAAKSAGEPRGNYRSRLLISVYMVLSTSMTGRTRLRCSYTSNASKSSAGKMDSVRGPIS